MKKILTIALSLGLALVLLAGCNSILPLPEGMDEDAIVADAKQAVDALNARDWAAFNGYFTDFDLSEEDWAGSFDPILDELGAFEDYGNIATTGYSEEVSDSDEVQYGLVLLTCNYENGKKVYQVTFDIDSELVGFHVVG